MKHGYVKVASATFDLQIANIAHNVQQIKTMIDQAKINKTKLLVFPELSITGYTIGDLVFQNSLLNGAKEGLNQIIQHTSNCDMVVCVGLPFQHLNSIYNCAAIIQNGSLLALVTKSHIPTYLEFYEGRHYSTLPLNTTVLYNDCEVPFGSEFIFSARNYANFTFGVEICEDAWVVNAPSNSMILKGATIIANLSASNELATKHDYRQSLISVMSAKGICGYIYCSAGVGESSTDIVYGGHQMIYENGQCLVNSTLYTSSIEYSEIDVNKMVSERRKISTFNSIPSTPIYFDIEHDDFELTRLFDKQPFIPNDFDKRNNRCKEILAIQTQGLVQRLRATNMKHVVIGVSGGLDSTLALLVCVDAFNVLNIPTKNIHAITMPCFGTTSRTKNNAIGLMEELNVSYETIDIHNTVMSQFEDLKHDPSIHDITYENVQARTRTQILMNKANKISGFVIGTGDLSEIALGWCTYNGDHMSMYAVNVSIPKTLVRYLVDYISTISNREALKQLLQDVLNTPVSPELIPAKDNIITQETEEIVGPYILHDFFLYHMVRFGDEPSKLLQKARIAFNDTYDEQTILKWMEVYYKRFFSQQFKRSCMPDGPKVGSVSLSPRGDWRMPSDANYTLWLKQIEELKSK